MTTEQENQLAEVMEELEQPEAELEQSVEATSEVVATSEDRIEALSKKVRACVLNGEGCQSLSDEINEAAEELAIELKEVVNQIFDRLSERSG